ncbi:MAG TPA: transcription factor [Sphingomonas sp.]|jgi:antitoxin VapB
MTPLHIEDLETAAAVARVARRLGISEAKIVLDAMRRIEAELNAAKPAEPRHRASRDVIEQYWREHPLPPPTGLDADKAFFDDLSGDA